MEKIIPEVIKNKIVAEANWRSTNGHGGVDDQLRDEFINHAEWGYQLATQQEGIIGIKKLGKPNDDGWRYDSEELRLFTAKVNEQECCETLSMEEVEAVLLALDESSPNQLQQEIEEVEETAKSFREYSLLRIYELEKERDELKVLMEYIYKGNISGSDESKDTLWEDFKKRNNL
jgi:hypothetical protein